MEHDSFLPLKDRPSSSSSNIMIPLNKIVPFDASPDFADSSHKTPDCTTRRFLKLEKMKKDDVSGREGGEGVEKVGRGEGMTDSERKKEGDEKNDDIFLEEKKRC